MKMIPDGQGTLKNYQYVDITESADEHFGLIPDDDDIQLQSPEAIALDGLLSDLEFMAESFQSTADMHWKNYENDTPPSYYTRHDTLLAFGIYCNKAQDMRELVNKWKLNKK